MYFHKEGLKHFMDLTKEAIRVTRGRDNENFLKKYFLTVLPELNEHVKNVIEHIQGDHQLEILRKKFLEGRVFPVLMGGERSKLTKDEIAAQTSTKNLLENYSRLDELTSSKFSEPTEEYENDYARFLCIELKNTTKSIIAKLEDILASLEYIHNQSITLANIYKDIVAEMEKFRHLLEFEIEEIDDFENNMRSWFTSLNVDN